MTQHVIDGSADGFGEAAVVEWGGIRATRHDLIVRVPVQLICRHPNLRKKRTFQENECVDNLNSMHFVLLLTYSRHS